MNTPRTSQNAAQGAREAIPGSPGGSGRAHARTEPHSVPRMSEDDLLTAVIDLAKLLGLRVHHTRPARTAHGWVTPISGHKGLPDLVIAGPGGVLWRELKSNTGRLTLDQVEWISALRESGQDAEVWRPQGLLFPYHIRAELEAIR